VGILVPRGRGRLRGGVNLGGEQAEADPLLGYVFYRSVDYNSIESRLDPRCFIIGRTGSGKSAALQHLAESYPDKVIRITPEDLSLPYIVDLRVVRYLDSLDVHLDLLWMALWKHVLLVELIRHRYKVDSPAAKQNFLDNLRDRIKRDPGKKAALEYLDEFGTKFWCETDERVREITETFQEKIDEEAKARFGLPHAGFTGGIDAGKTLTTASRAEQADRFQRIVNETQLARLNKMLSVLDEDILDRPQYSTYVIIDDLDREWIDERLANDLIRCLFTTVLFLKRVRHLKVLVALRTNIFHELDFGVRGGQEEKFRSLVLQMRWSKDDLEELMDERVRYMSNQSGGNLTSVKDILPAANRTRGYAFDYILDRTLMRPRDTISYLNECLSAHSGNGYISWEEIASAERAYSEKRLLALRDEWKPTFPDIQKVFELFRKAIVPISKSRFTEYLDEAMLLLTDRSFSGVRWMTRLSEKMWSSTGNQSWADLYQPLTEMLYEIGFVGFIFNNNHAQIYSYDDPALADNLSTLEKVNSFSIHPAYHMALGIKENRENPKR
jgi:hypothetical protein